MPHPLGLPKREFRTPQPFVTGPSITSIDANSGRIAGGSTVTITGLNFRLAADGSKPTVKFDTVTATGVTIVSATSLTCTVPAASVAGVVDVSVTIGSQTGTLTLGFTYYTSTITSVTPNHGPAAGNTSVVIDGFNFVEGSLIYFDGVQATGILFMDTEHYVCQTPAHAYGFIDVTLVEPA